MCAKMHVFVTERVIGLRRPTGVTRNSVPHGPNNCVRGPYYSVRGHYCFIESCPPSLDYVLLSATFPVAVRFDNGDKNSH